jgi:hypothetical protein
VTSTDFRPDSDGFAFRNSFQFDPVEQNELISKLAPAIDAALGTIGPLGLAARLTGVSDGLRRIALSAVPQNYGLCGGMAFAALDYYKSGLAMPRGSGPMDQPPPGSDLRGYLWDRLRDSWRLNGVTFLEWKARLHLVPTVWPFGGGPRALRDRSKTEWKKLCAEIDGGRPTVIGLVGELTDPFQDHQVLAYRYEPSADDNGTIFVYDSNCPDAAQTIALKFDSEKLEATESCGRPGNPLRGFFCETYEKRTPTVVA